MKQKLIHIFIIIFLLFTSNLFAQDKIVEIPEIELEEVKHLTTSTRGVGGYGSTGN